MYEGKSTRVEVCMETKDTYKKFIYYAYLPQNSLHKYESEFDVFSSYLSYKTD